jgi:hypothetical protein
MNAMDLDFGALADAYLRNHRSSDKDKDFWAWKEVHEMVRADLEKSWPLILLLLENANKDDEVRYIAAGPLEDLIDMHGHKALDLIEGAAEKNKHLQLALSSVCVLFYYEEFDRWHDLLCRYGYNQNRFADASRIVAVVTLMRAYLNGRVTLQDYDERVNALLDTPFEDKDAQRILQKASWDLERCRPDRAEAPELKQQTAESLAKLESLGYKPL